MHLARREFLKLGMGLPVAAKTAASFRTTPSEAPAPIPRVNGGINVQPVRRLDPNAGFEPPLIEPGIVDAQMRAVYELGFEQMRITISFDRFGPDFLAAIPYVRAGRALGLDVCGVIGQFTGFDLVQAISDRATRDEVLETYAGIFADPVLPSRQDIETGSFAAQVLNEPTNFLGLSPDVYVREYLRPAYLHLKEDVPGLTIVSAATVGSAEGVARARAMIEAGLELHCDVVALHVYSRLFLDELSQLSERPIWITETGTGSPPQHLDWFTGTIPALSRAIPNVERVFWFDLFDLEPGRFRLVDVRETIYGSFEYVPESSDLIEHLHRNVRLRQASNADSASYRELIPDIALYLPTEEDIRRVLSTSIGAERWGR
jgi:hypothetical protein